MNLIGLRTSIIVIPFSNNYHEIAKIAVQKLIIFERENGIQRETDFQKLRREAKDSKGAIDKSYQLILDDRKRTPLENIDYPEGDFQQSYSIIDQKNLPLGKISKIQVKINLPADLSMGAIIYNLKHCNASIFNDYKPEALSILAYSDKASNFQGFDHKYNVASCDFALYGDFGKAEEGFAYNMPVSKFEHTIQFEESYFDTNLKMTTSSEFMENLMF